MQINLERAKEKPAKTKNKCQLFLTYDRHLGSLYHAKCKSMVRAWDELISGNSRFRFGWMSNFAEQGSADGRQNSEKFRRQTEAEGRREVTCLFCCTCIYFSKFYSLAEGQGFLICHFLFKKPWKLKWKISQEQSAIKLIAWPPVSYCDRGQDNNNSNKWIY